MAKAVTIKVKLVSTADTGFYYTAKKNSRTMTEKMVKKKYDPIAKPLDNNVEQQLMRQVVRPSAVKARALALAAIRETFEETGLLLGARHEGAAGSPDGPWAEFAKAGF